MIENLSDNEIVQRLRQYDEQTTSEFFYDVCRMAYIVDDRKYGLRHKTGMDFYSLAHEYYLRLCSHDFKQLDNRKEGYSLARWTMNGFHFLVRERLKTYSKGYQEESIEERASKGQVVFDAPVDNSAAEVVDMVEEICHGYYGHDRSSQGILRMILVMGMKGKEVAAMMGITPAAVSQRYHRMMDNVVRPYFIKYYRQESYGMAEESAAPTSYSIVHDEPVRPCVKASESRSPEPPMKARRSWLDRLFRREAEKSSSRRSFADRITPSVVETLRENEVFVFGSDLRGIHCGGSAYQALRRFGAILGQGAGPQGRSYAIPTIVGGLEHIRPYVDEFFAYAESHPGESFLVTPVGCGIAGFTPHEIAPLFARARQVRNVCLPESFWRQIGMDDVMDDWD